MEMGGGETFDPPGGDVRRPRGKDPPPLLSRHPEEGRSLLGVCRHRNYRELQGRSREHLPTGMKRLGAQQLLHPCPHRMGESAAVGHRGGHRGSFVEIRYSSGRTFPGLHRPSGSKAAFT
jgi:hypothetical protein